MKVKAKDLVKATGVNPAAISHAVKRKLLVRDEKKYFDLENPFNRDWCMKHGINIKSFEKTISVGAEAEKVEKIKKKQEIDLEKKKNQKKSIKLEIDDPDSLSNDDFENLSGLPARMRKLNLDQLVIRYGGPMHLKSYVDILNTVMASQKKDVEIQERRKELVSKKFISYLKAYVDTYLSRLFDYADGCAAEIISLAIADKEKAKIKIPELLRKNFSKYAEETQRRIDKDIKNLKVEETDEQDYKN